MERRNRNILVTLIAAVIVVAMLSSFGMGLFMPDTAEIILPTPETTGQPGAAPGEVQGLVRVEVTPDTVQNVIRTLVRPASYAREVTVEDIWGEGESGITTAQVWVDGGWTMTRAVWPSGTVRTTIVGDGQFWLWYSGSNQVVTGPAEEDAADLEGQRIPTYEDVLALDPEEIAAAGYESREGVSCIYVETAPDQLGYVERYWISDDSGLLVCAETAVEERVVYRMSAYTVERPVPADTAFALPDGTLLHQPGE